MAKLRVVLLGCGNNMRGRAGRLSKHPGVEIVALCDVKPELVQEFIHKNLPQASPAPQVFTDPAAMFAQAKPDAAFISTPHTLHFQHGMTALAGGCHVLMEKPMVTSAPDAYTLAAKAKETGKVLVIGYNTPCTPEFNYLRQAIRDKTLGRLEVVNGYLSQNWMHATVNKWRQEPKLSGGGQAYDSGAHLLNSLCWSVESKVAEVSAFVDNHGTAVDINSVIIVRFESGVLASIAIGGNCPGNGRHMVYLFERGRVEIDGWSGKWINVFDDKGQKIENPALIGAVQTPDDNFIDAILGRAQPRTSPLNGIVQSELMDAIYESARTGMAAKPKKLADVMVVS